jgi:hypothetical protein
MRNDFVYNARNSRYPRVMSIVKERARAAIEKHNGVRAAARALRISAGVLSMLADGKRPSASPKTLRALGLKRIKPIIDHEPIRQ